MRFKSFVFVLALILIGMILAVFFASRKNVVAAADVYADMTLSHSLELGGVAGQRVWDVAADDASVYALTGSPSVSSVSRTDWQGNVLHQFSLPASASGRFTSGRIKSDGLGQIYVLRRASNGTTEIIYADTSGRIQRQFVPDPQIMEIIVSHGQLWAASTSMVYLVKDGQLQPWASCSLSYPFALLSSSPRPIAVLEFQDGLIRFVDHEQATAPVALEASEFNERNVEFRRAGAGALFEATTDLEDNVYVGLPNFSPSMNGRILTFNSSGKLIRRLRFALPMNPATNTHLHPFKFAVGRNHLSLSVLGQNRLYLFSL